MRVVRIYQWLDDYVPIKLVFYNVVTQAGHDRFVLSFYLSICVVMVCRWFRMIVTERLHIVAENFLTNCGSLSVRNDVVIPYGISQ